MQFSINFVEAIIAILDAVAQKENAVDATTSRIHWRRLLQLTSFIQKNQRVKPVLLNICFKNKKDKTRHNYSGQSGTRWSQGFEIYFMNDYHEPITNP